MGNLKKQILSSRLILPLIVLALIGAFKIHFSNLGWGTPNKERTLAVLGSEKELKEHLPKMLELRQSYYKSLEKMVDPNEPFKENYQRAYLRHNQTPPFAEIPKDSVLDQMRAYLVGVMNSDEQNTLVAINQLRSLLKPNFTPEFATFYYGGSYLFLSGAFLATAGVFNWIHLTSEIEYYFFHPEEIQKMYKMVRFVGPLFLLLSAIFLFFLLKNRFAMPLAFLGVVFYLYQPGWIFYGHSAKPHVYAAGLLAIGLFWCSQILEKPKPIHYIFASLFLGLCAGSLIVNITAVVILILAEAIRLEWRWREIIVSRFLWLGLAVSAFVFFLTNFHFFLYFKSFSRLVMAWEEFGTGYGHLELGKIPSYLYDIGTIQIHWLCLPILVLGIVLAFKKKNKFGLLIGLSWLILFLQDLITTRHLGSNLRTLPFYAIFFGLAINELSQSKQRVISYLGVGFATLGLAFGVGQSCFYSSLFNKPMNIDKASVWIQNNIPKEASIGISNGQFSPGSFPAMRFLDYALIAFPTTEGFNWQEARLPNYLISTNDRHASVIQQFLNDNYAQTVSWPKKDRFFRIPFRNTGIDSNSTRIYKKIGSEFKN